MDRLNKFYDILVEFLTHCIEQDFISETEQDYILGEIEKIKEQVINEN